MEIPSVRTNVYQCLKFKEPHGWRTWYFLISWRSGRTQMVEIRDDYNLAVIEIRNRVQNEVSETDVVDEILLAPDKNWTN